MPITARWVNRGIFKYIAIALLFASALGCVAQTWPVGPVAKRCEIRLLKGLIEQRYLASQLASLGQSRSTHPELQTICVYKSWALNSEIAHYRSLLGEWYLLDIEPRLTPRDTRTINKLSALTGEEFEAEFLKTMIKLDSSALRLGRQCASRCRHPELPDMWHFLGAEFESESAQFRAWLCEWYSRCKGIR